MGSARLAGISTHLSAFSPVLAESQNCFQFADLTKPFLTQMPHYAYA